MRMLTRPALCGLLAAAGISWCAEGAIAAPASAQALASIAAASAGTPGLTHVGGRWYPPQYDDEGYSPPAGYLPPPVSYYRYAPRKPIVQEDPPPYFVPPPTVACDRRQCVILPQW
jgi:hypothetical protein